MASIYCPTKQQRMSCRCPGHHSQKTNGAKYGSTAEPMQTQQLGVTTAL